MRASLPFLFLLVFGAAIAVAQQSCARARSQRRQLRARWAAEFRHRPRLNFTVFGPDWGCRAADGLVVPAGHNAGRTSIKVTVAGSTVNAILLYASANQVAAILPPRLRLARAP